MSRPSTSLKILWAGPNLVNCFAHGLRTPNKGIDQRYLKNWANVVDKICCRHTKKFGSGSEFSAVQ